MVRASQRTGLFDRLSAILLLPPEMLLRVAIRVSPLLNDLEALHQRLSHNGLKRISGPANSFGHTINPKAIREFVSRGVVETLVHRR